MMQAGQAAARRLLEFATLAKGQKVRIHD